MAVEQIASYVRRVLAPNPGPRTLEGTNTWVLGDVEQAPGLVVDPGPADEDHLRAVLEACGGAIAEIVLTHRHPDHSEGAARLATLGGCGVRAADPQWRIGPAALANGNQLEVAGARLIAYATPGHTADSFSLLVTGVDGVSRLVTGDTVLGRGTTVIAPPDGDLRGYLESLASLQDLVRDHRVSELLPGHGPVVTSPESWLSGYVAHRYQRLGQVRDAVAAGDRTPAEVVARVYADIDPSLWPAAEQSVVAQLAYLEET